jgi:hypothetical protein
MVATINQNYISQFSDNIHMLLNQRTSKLMPIFEKEMKKGEKHFFDRLGNLTVNEIVGRAQPVVLQDPAHSRRMASVRRYEASVGLDDIDKMKMLIDPTNGYVMKLAQEHGKNFDAVVIDALLGTAATGADGSGSQALGSGQQIAHGSTGFTIAKFNQAMRLLEEAEVDVDMGELVLLLPPKGREDLFAEAQYTSFDYQNGKPLAGGGVSNFRGVDIIITNRLPEHTAGSVYRGVFCTRDSLKVAMAHDLEIKVAERPDLNFLQQVSTYMMFGAVRMEEAKVVDVLFQ